MKKVFAILILFCPYIISAHEDINSIDELQDAGVLLIDSQGKAILSSQAGKNFIPASTTKLVTAWLALTHWGADYHFKTNFYWDNFTNTLWVKGNGDPFLVSEELLVIARNLKRLGLKKIDAIGLDDSYFQTDLSVPGSSVSSNPYDAVPTAIAANFNTITIKSVAGRIVSAEKQTPLTSFAKTYASQQKLSQRKIRINTGRSTGNAERYFAELLAAFLRQQDVDVGEQIIWGKVNDLPVYYCHKNSKSLAEMIRPMMKYSTNFIANQLVLMLSADHYQRPANFKDVSSYMEEKLHEEFQWQHFSLKEGAGLSRQNKLSPHHLVQLLEAFRPWKHLLPEVTPGVYAKSGTLNKVSTLAGYSVNRNNQWNAFAIMIKQSVSHKRRNQIASEFITLSIPK